MKHRLPRCVALFLTSLFLAPGLLAQEPPPAGAPEFEVLPAEFEITPELLEQTAAEVAAAVGETLSVPLGDVSVQLATRQEIEAALKVELLPQFLAQFEDAKQAEAQCMVISRLSAKTMLAKFSTETSQVLVCEGNFNRLAQALERPGLATPEVLRAVLCHELVHAADQRAYRWDQVAATRDSTESIQAYSAVVEGHAQRVARQVCAARGWSEAFELFTEAIGLSPDTGDAALNYAGRVLAVTNAFAYHDGERFIEAVEQAGGAEAVKRAFAEPPTETVLILEPRWYLDPATRPALEFDLEDTLESFAVGWDDEVWAKRQTPLLRPQLQASLGLMPKERVDRLLGHLNQCRVLVLSAKESPANTRMVMAALYETDSTTAATELLVLEEDLMRAKDEQLTQGMVKIEDVHYEQVARGPVRGMFASKRVLLGEFDIPVFVLVASRGRLVVELNYIGEAVDLDGLFDAATQLLEPRAPREAEEATEEEGDSDE